MGKRTGNPRGRPRGSGTKAVDLEKLKALALIGASYEVIATECGVSHNTIQRRFLPLIKESRGKGKIKILSKSFQLACAGNTRMLELFLINWCEFVLHPQTQINVTQNSGTFAPSDETRRKLAQLHADIRKEALSEGDGHRFET